MASPNRILVVVALLCFGLGVALANNVRITNVTLPTEVTPAAGGGYTVDISYDLSWENSWRISAGPANWDGVYVFARYREDGGLWKFLGDVSAAAPTGFNKVGPSGQGQIVYRAVDGSGDVSLTGVQYLGRIADPLFDPNAELEVRLFATEMVWIPRGDFEVGQGGGTATNEFFYARLLAGGPAPWPVQSEASIRVGVPDINSPGFTIAQDGARAGEDSGIIPAAYPKGHRGFWMMRYEVSQEQYVDFFNTLDEGQKFSVDPTSSSGKNSDAEIFRNGVSYTTGSDMATTLPNVPMTFVRAQGMLAYLDWAGLRPMTEFEFAKAARGTRPSVEDEYAWGTADITAGTYTTVDLGTADERYTTGFSATVGNALYRGTRGVIQGPGRVGGVAASATQASRQQSGAGYYGVMDLSGNVYEAMISAGSVTSRAFEDVRGDYEFDLSFFPSGPVLPTSWPDPSSESFAFRGGSWAGPAPEQLVADRTWGLTLFTTAYSTVGFRGVVRADFDNVR